MQDDVLEIMFESVPGWRAFEVEDGIGLAKASAIRELPYKLDPKRAPYAKKLRWEGNIFNAAITPTRDVITKEWITYRIEPVLIFVAPHSSVDPDEIAFMESNYKQVAKVEDDGVHNGDIYHMSREEDSTVAHSLVVVFDDLDIQVSFSFSAANVVEDAEIIKTVIQPLVQIASNFRKSPALDIMGAFSRSSRSTANLAFEYSVFGTFIPEGSFVIHPTHGLEDWKLYAHNGNEAIFSMLSLETITQTPNEIAEHSANKILEIPVDGTGSPALGWRHEGLQLFLVPPKEIEHEGVTPLLITISISNERVARAHGRNYDIIHSDDKDTPGGVEILAFGPTESDVSSEIGRYDHSFLSMSVDTNCTVNGMYVSDSEEPSPLYDDAFILISRNIGEYLRRIDELNETPV